jgi:hypothetical protein
MERACRDFTGKPTHRELAVGNVRK